MKLLVFSDSHGRNLGLYDAIEREAPDAVAHLGDYTGDAAEVARSYRLLPVYQVRGNNDFEPDVPLSNVIRPQNVPIYLTHGHKERVSMLSCGVIPRTARQQGCALAFFGHTHRMMLERVNGVLVCNPGSISLPRGGPASYARLTIEDGAPRLLELVEEDGALLRREKIGQI